MLIAEVMLGLHGLESPTALTVSRSPTAPTALKGLELL